MAENLEEATKRATVLYWEKGILMLTLEGEDGGHTYQEIRDPALIKMIRSVAPVMLGRAEKIELSIRRLPE